MRSCYLKLKANEIIKYLNNLASLDLAEEWDNSGIQVGNIDREIKKILLVMDVDTTSLDLAIRGGFDMIISHHPLIFKGLKSITNLDKRGSLIMDIIKNDIVVYSGHTNFDLIADGVSYQLAKVLGLRLESVLKNTSNTDEKIGYGIVGRVDKIKLQDYASLIKEKLNLQGLVAYGDLEGDIEKVGLCGGSGGDLIVDASQKKVDLYITGDIKYHDSQLAQDLGLSLLDIGHFHSEKYILRKIKELLLGEFKNLEIEIIEESSILKKYL